MISTKNLTLLAALAAISCAGVANADVYGPFTSATVGPLFTAFGLGTGANPTVTLSLPTFNTSLGTLTGISFSLSGTVSTMFSGQDKSGNNNNVTLTSQGTLSLYAPPTATAANLITLTTPTNTFGPIPVAPNATFGPQTVTATGSMSVPSYSGSFLPFETSGAGSISLPVSGTGQSSASDDNGNITTTIRTQGSAFATVSYIYTAKPTGVPEPGSVAMLLAVGVAGTGFFLRRRRVSNPGRVVSPYDM